MCDRRTNYGHLQTAKGLVFVTLSAGLVYTLVKRSHDELAQTASRLETPLTHTTGIALWPVWAAVEASGGSLDVETLSPRGTVVSLRVPTTAS
ncbi:hypothetical protein ACH9L7_15385 [Haloferax sp. S1W]|uniref:hypothetical protein n=1 Tax=Haloferax sp. S1W TaxID=3377110 RepID=UPI0037CA88DD